MDGISGWIVETTRYILEFSPLTYGTIENEDSNALWQLDYRSTSIYQPCA